MSATHTNPPEASRLFGVIVTYRRSRQLESVLSGIRDQSRALDRLVVVDNSPSRATRELIEQHRNAGHPTDHVESAENIGPAGGTAVAMEHFLAQAGDDDWLVRIDDDRPPPDRDLFRDLEAFARTCVERDAMTGAVGLVGARYSWTRGRLDRVPESELAGPVPVDYLATNHFPLFRFGAIRRAGPFDARLFFGSSEVEYGLRLRAHGISIYAHGDRWRMMRPERTDPLRPRVRVTQPNWRRYYSLRNQIYILRAHDHGATAMKLALLRGVLKPLANLPASPRLALANLRLNVRAIRDGWAGRLGRTVEPDDPTLDAPQHQGDVPG